MLTPPPHVCLSTVNSIGGNLCWETYSGSFSFFLSFWAVHNGDLPSNRFHSNRPILSARDKFPQASLSFPHRRPHVPPKVLSASGALKLTARAVLSGEEDGEPKSQGVVSPAHRLTSQFSPPSKAPIGWNQERAPPLVL